MLALYLRYWWFCARRTLAWGVLRVPSMTKHSCKERLTAELHGRLADLRKFAVGGFNSDTDVPDLGSFNEYGLSFDYVAPGTFRDQRRGYWRYQLSWGGPSDEFRFYGSDERSVPDRIEYWFLDWFDGAHRVLRGKQEALLLHVWQEYERAMREVV